MGCRRGQDAFTLSAWQVDDNVLLQIVVRANPDGQLLELVLIGLWIVAF